MVKTLTVEFLEDNGACTTGRRAFKRKYKRGAKTETVIYAAAVFGRYWLGWLLSHTLEQSEQEWLRWELLQNFGMKPGELINVGWPALDTKTLKQMFRSYFKNLREDWYVSAGIRPIS